MTDRYQPTPRAYAENGSNTNYKGPISPIFEGLTKPQTINQRGRECRQIIRELNLDTTFMVVEADDPTTTYVMQPGAEDFVVATPENNPNIEVQKVLMELRTRTLVPGDPGFQERKQDKESGHQSLKEVSPTRGNGMTDKRIRQTQNLATLTGWYKGKYYERGKLMFRNPRFNKEGKA